MSTKLNLLAEKLGIATSFCDAGMVQKNYAVSEDTIRFFATELGFKCGDEQEIETSLQQIDNMRFINVLSPIYVCKIDLVKIDVVLPDKQKVSSIRLKDANHKLQDVSFLLQEEIEEKTINKSKFRKETYIIKGIREPGYYELDVRLEDRNYKSIVAVAPQKCYETEGMDHKLWGFAIQLYSVRSKRNWGVGDFTDLKELVKLCAKSGANVIGLNPLNVLSHDFPENASPYQSISRLFLNPIYIDVEQIPEFENADKQLIEGILAGIKSSEYIQYNKVYPLKVKVLEKCFKRLLKKKTSARYKDFIKYCQTKGADLDKLALFQCLYESESPKVWGGWRAWPEELRSPYASGISDYISNHQERIDFFKFMQFEAERQFDEVKTIVDQQNLKIGLYRDLAVGVGKDSAEYWGDNELFIPKCGAGAPPDAFFPCGQQWGLGVFSPYKLKEHAYEPFIKILRANMHNSGALRMDHVMSLMRLYVIPENCDEGTYIYFNFADMLNIVALESHLNKCVIVGESIGNVPEGFIETIRSRNIHSLSVLWSERSGAGWGGFLAPQHYPEHAFASVGTHDMSPLKMWWFGFDIELASSLGMITNDTDKANAYHKRENDRGMLLASLDAANVWPQDRLRSGNFIYGENYPEGIEEAVCAYVAKSSSIVFLAQLEDFLHMTKQQNLPGTDRDKHPNWRLKLPVDLENLENDIGYVRNVLAIRKER
ncbi:MAG: 4-alpha-glucanotransferase [Alphaproteobacteria bacterium]|nr:4-alpha-glucanotransferase [Alphaproteobacteria bacterium]